MIALFRPRFTREERNIIWNMIQDEMDYLVNGAPVCRFTNEAQAAKMIDTLDANSQRS